MPVLWLHTRFLIYRLRNQKKQPLVASNDLKIGIKMVLYLNITFAVVELFYLLILYNPLPRFNFWNEELKAFDRNMVCGPFKSNNVISPAQEVGLIVSSDSALFKIVTSNVFVGCAYILCIWLIVHWNNLISNIKEFKLQKLNEYETQLSYLSDTINKLELKAQNIKNKRLR